MARPYQKANIPGPEMGISVSDPAVMANFLKSPSKKVFVIGAGAMGNGIAQVSAEAGYDVTMMDIKEINECGDDITAYYDDLIEYSSWYNLLGEGKHKVNGKTVEIDLYELKKKLWMCLASVNVLEGIRFYVSFACSWAFAELKKMEGNAKIIKFIARDENVHLASTQQLMKLLPSDDKDFVKIAKECEPELIKMFEDAVEQENTLTRFTAPFNFSGLPAISLPCGFTDQGLPIGLQIITRPWGEAAALRAAQAYESATEWYLRRPNFSE